MEEKISEGKSINAGLERSRSRQKPSRMRIPMWAQLTLLVFAVSIVSVVVLVLIMGLKVWQYSTQLMEQRLGVFATLTAAQASTSYSSDLMNYESKINDKIVPIMWNKYLGNFNATDTINLQKNVEQMFAGDDAVVAVVLYNPDLSYLSSWESTQGLIKALSYQLPFSDRTRSAQAHSYLQWTINATSNSSDSNYYYNDSGYAYGSSTTAYVMDPEPFTDTGNNIQNYTYSITVAATHSTDNRTAIGVGYVTMLLKSYTLVQLAPAAVSNLLSQSSLYLTRIINSTHFKYVLPNGITDDTITAFPYSALPVMSDCWTMLQDSSYPDGTLSPPGRALMRSSTPNLSKASLGFTYANIFNEKWFFIVSIPQGMSYTQVNHLRDVVIGVSFAIVGAIFILVVPLSRWQTAPLYRIYSNMGFESRGPTHKYLVGRRRHTRSGSNSDDNEDDDDPDDLVPKDSYSSSSGGDHSETRQYPLTRNPGVNNRVTGPLPPENISRSMAPSSQSRVMPQQATNGAPYRHMGNRKYKIRQQSPPSLALQTTLIDDGHRDEEEDICFPPSTSFQIPARLPLLKRWWTDELDELVTGYNRMVDKLNNQYLYLEDEVRARTEEAQEARLLAEAANEAKSQFIANITHELRTPLNGIMGMTSVSVAETNPAKIRASLATIIDSGKVLVQLLTELLAFSKTQVGVEPVIQPFTTVEILTNLHQLFKSRAESRAVNLSTAAVPEELGDIQLFGDSERILQTCMNIVSNAMKFSDANGSVSIVAHLRRSTDHLISLDPYAQTPLPDKIIMLEILIADTGVGMNTRQLSKIFDLFVQGDNTLSKKHKGTGLGMSMSRQLSEGIGGYVAVFSAEGAGSTVAVRVPVGCNLKESELDALQGPPIEFTVPNVYMTISLQAGTVTKVPVFGNNFAEKAAQRTVRTPATSGRPSISMSILSNNMTPSISPPKSPRRPSRRSKTFSFDDGIEASAQDQEFPKIKGPSILTRALSLLPQGLIGDAGRTDKLPRSRDDMGHMHKYSVSSSFGGQSSLHQQISGPFSLNRHLTAPSSQQRLSQISSSGKSSKSFGVTSVNSTQPTGGGLAPSVNGTHDHVNISKLGATQKFAPGLTIAPTTPADGQSSNSEEATKSCDGILREIDRSARVLVADDNSLNVQIIVRMLQQLGIIHIDTALNGDRVIELVEQAIILGEHYRLIFMDLAMPRTNGIEATNFIRGTLGYPYPIVALTGFSDQQTLRACKAANIQEVLSKPVMKQDLIKALAEYASKDKPSRTH